jgi:hypothetical protein
MIGINWIYKDPKNSKWEATYYGKKWVEKILHDHIKEGEAATASLDASS